MIALLTVAVALVTWTLGYRHGVERGMEALRRTCGYLVAHNVPEAYICKALEHGKDSLR